MTALIAFVREFARNLESASASWKAIEQKAGTSENDSNFAHGMATVLKEIAVAVKSAASTTLFT